MKNYNKDNTTGKNHEGAYPNRPLKYLTASSIIGDKILNKKGEDMGEIKDVMIDLDTGKIEYFIVELGGFLGIGEKYFAFPFRLLKVNSKSETFLLDQDLQTLKKAPGFDKEHWPKTNSHEFDQSGSYWGGFMSGNTGVAY